MTSLLFSFVEYCFVGEVVCFLMIISFKKKNGGPEMNFEMFLLFWEIIKIFVHIFLKGQKQGNVK